MCGKKLSCKERRNAKILKQAAFERVLLFTEGVVTSCFLLVMVPIIVIYIASWGFSRMAILMVVLCVAQFSSQYYAECKAELQQHQKCCVLWVVGQTASHAALLPV